MVRTVPVVSDDWGAEFMLMPSFTAGVHAWIIAAIVTVVLIYSAIVSSSIGLYYAALDYRISYLIIACHTCLFLFIPDYCVLHLLLVIDSIGVSSSTALGTRCMPDPSLVVTNNGMLIISVGS
jgi:hypothetical protein